MGIMESQALTQRNNSTITVLSVKEVAVALDVSRMTVYRMLLDGELPYIQIRDQKRIPLRDLEEYVTRETVRAPKPASEMSI